MAHKPSEALLYLLNKYISYQRNLSEFDSAEEQLNYMNTQLTNFEYEMSTNPEEETLRKEKLKNFVSVIKFMKYVDENDLYKELKTNNV